MPGLLIVNADDFGGGTLATDRILECFAAGAISSATAMVYMLDSERAASLARADGLPIGLHLNLTQEFEDRSTPPAIRERQARAVRYFSAGRRRRFTYNPLLNPLVRACIADQLECFRELFGTEPTHLDGHNHAHLSPTVLFALPRELPIRTGERSHKKNPVLALLARTRLALIARRGVTTDRFYAINILGPSPTESEIERLLVTADHLSVEIMTHPNHDPDHRLLMSDAWRSALRRHALGSFAQLARA